MNATARFAIQMSDIRMSGPQASLRRVPHWRVVSMRPERPVGYRVQTRL
jgi:hypothetical protein